MLTAGYFIVALWFYGAYINLDCNQRDDKTECHAGAAGAETEDDREIEEVEEGVEQ